MREKILLSWSGGKDSAMALYELRGDPRLEVTGLLTTISEAYRRISHHGVREELLEIQAEAIGLPLHKVYLPSAAPGPCRNGPYEELMESVLTKFRERGISAVAHGDIFLEDLRAYRERNLDRVGLRALFPIWRRDTVSLVREFARLGFRAVLTCVEGKLGKSFAGQPVDAQLLEDLPDWADPCGENGEYHSFVYDGPIFRRPVDVRVGEIVERDGRFYADLLPAGDPRSWVGPDDIPPV
jgi:uncharacterized protein (TIGR00290 family)